MVQRAFYHHDKTELPEDITDKERERYNKKYGTNEALKLEFMGEFWEYFFKHLNKKGHIEGGEWWRPKNQRD